MAKKKTEAKPNTGPTEEFKDDRITMKKDTLTISVKPDKTDEWEAKGFTKA